ncbi:hypothetical protein SXIM_53900 [Streptomyces xiamenensis]|uniref:Uncharacterized protein n=1 Tax=Streptomyces xiamenensis TaxID=408015 RepID=A0A0F7G0R6_9ACTN|nr:hypothetical protein SXIM_53900 [Streptomyces xiamenensis]
MRADRLPPVRANGVAPCADPAAAAQERATSKVISVLVSMTSGGVTR